MKKNFVLYSVITILLVGLLITIVKLSDYNEIINDNEAVINQLKIENEELNKVNEDSVLLNNNNIDFSKTPEGYQIEIMTRKFAEAYLSGDVTEMKKYVIDSEESYLDWNKNNIYDKVSFLILKMIVKDAEEDTVILEYEFDVSGEDSLTYLYIELKKDNDQWKVKYWGLEK